MDDINQEWVPVLYMKDGRSGREVKKEYPQVNVVYFVRAAQWLKIGTTIQIMHRFEGLQSGSPVKLEMLGLIHGGVHVERWCQYHCIKHRSHYEWFHWNEWTESFVKWVLKHGDHAAKQLCPAHIKSDIATTVPGKSRVFRYDIPQMPQMKYGNDVDRLRSYLKSADRAVEPLGACRCSTCIEKPWERWSAAG